jgi:hypothetical protein
LILKNEGGDPYASILREMPRQEGDQERQIDHDEEWQAGNSRRLPCLRHQDVPDWQELGDLLDRLVLVIIGERAA